MSGAGKSSALKMLEDIGFFCVDNLPVGLLGKFADLAEEENADVTKTAIGIDIRSGAKIAELENELIQLEKRGVEFQILFLNASNRILIKRYKETRRNHPLARNGRIEDGILKEREAIDFLKNSADCVIDTSQLLTRDLKNQIDQIFLGNQPYGNFNIAVSSFGFKHGIPVDVDLVFDVRFLPNPFYDLELRPMTGNDQVIQDFVLNCEEASEFLDKLEDMLKFLIPNYIKEGKYNLVIGIGCTGGKHRSVTIANKLAERLKSLPYMIKVEHRDIMR